jgi:type II secretory ATPase GspE/PulE/Tfp pilus assembly ATPase PilB-like protein
VIAQRLVRTLCPDCRVPFDVSDSPQTFEEVRPWLAHGQGRSLYGPAGCAKCHSLGYVGRSGVFEVLPVTREIRRLIEERASVQTIVKKGIEQGMIEFRRSALLKVAQGATSIEEVHRCIPVEHLKLED